jgi:hypothetical protein
MEYPVPYDINEDSSLIAHADNISDSFRLIDIDREFIRFLVAHENITQLNALFRFLTDFDGFNQYYWKSDFVNILADMIKISPQDVKKTLSRSGGLFKNGLLKFSHMGKIDITPTFRKIISPSFDN